MTRYIDADAIDKRYVPIAPVIDGDDVHYEWVAFVEDINEQPTIDAIPIDYLRSQVDSGKWEEIITRWKEVDTPTVDTPTIDAVPIIRCKDCRYNPKISWVGCPMAGNMAWNQDGFCSRAEPKENG